MSRSPYLKENKKSKLDYILGLQLIAIILYGILPSILAILDIDKGKITTTTQNLFFLLIIALIPVSILFLLIKNKLDKYYLMRDYSICRAIFITFIILMGSVLVVGLSRTVNGYYRIVSFSECELFPFVESFILASASLLLTSTLFGAFLFKDLELPGLPKNKFMNSILKIREQLSKISKNQVFEQEDVGKEVYEEIESLVQKSKTALASIQKSYLTLNLFKQLVEDLSDLGKSINFIKQGSPNSWKRYFCENNRQNIYSDDEKMFQRNMRIKKSNWR